MHVVRPRRGERRRVALQTPDVAGSATQRPIHAGGLAHARIWCLRSATRRAVHRRTRGCAPSLRLCEGHDGDTKAIERRTNLSSLRSQPSAGRHGSQSRHKRRYYCSGAGAAVRHTSTRRAQHDPAPTIASYIHPYPPLFRALADRGAICVHSARSTRVPT